MWPHFFILYDGIQNSVFTSQVLNPLIKQIEQKKLDQVIIISFEKNKVPQHTVDAISKHSKISIKIIPRSKFWGWIGLRVAGWGLRLFLAKFDSYTITARGPLAGYIAQIGKTNQCAQLTIQARGLAAEEYKYTHKNSIGIKKWWHRFRASQYEKVERLVYGSNDKTFIIEAVSQALKKYLVKNFDANTDQISIAQSDNPPSIEKEQKEQFRKNIRNQLAIQDHTTVYCYNGSAQPWQCPEMVVKYFCEKLQSDKNSFLLILTQDQNTFLRRIKESKINSMSYHILSVPHEQVCSYLAACDVGLLFREPHIINWVSRPTKLLEYQAVGIEVVHNDTIAVLAEK